MACVPAGGGNGGGGAVTQVQNPGNSVPGFFLSLVQWMDKDTRSPGGVNEKGIGGSWVALGGFLMGAPL